MMGTRGVGNMGMSTYPRAKYITYHSISHVRDCKGCIRTCT